MDLHMSTPQQPHHQHNHPAHHRQESHQTEEQTDGQGYLSGEQILPQRLRPNMTVAELIDSAFQAYNSARLNEACRLYAEQMLDPEQDVTIGPTMAGALTPAG